MAQNTQPKTHSARLLFGTGGIPLTTKNRSAQEGIKRINELGLDAMELEFVYSVFLDEAQASELKQIAHNNDVVLSVHGSYFVNLASEDKKKWYAGINRIIKAAKIGDLAGAKYLTFHSGFRQRRDDSVVYDLIKKGLEKILEEVDDLNIRITPELTGKASQWGDLDELIQMVKDFGAEKLGFCFDFAHKHARDGGGYNSKAEFDEMLDKIGNELGQSFLDDMHIHISGINYTEKGERNHLTLLGDYEDYLDAGLELEGMEKHYETFRKKKKIGPPDLKWKELLDSLKKHKVSGIVVCESPNLEHDALLMKKTYESL